MNMNRRIQWTAILFAAILVVSAIPASAVVGLQSPDSGTSPDKEATTTDRIGSLGTSTSTASMQTGTSSDLNMTLEASVTDATALDGVDDLDRNGNMIYAVGFLGDTVAAVDVSDPKNPTVVNHVQDSVKLDQATDIFYRNGYAFVTAAGGTGDGTFTVVDVSDPASGMNIVTSISDSTRLVSPDDLKVQGDYAFVADSGSNRMTVIDISSQTSPKIVGSITDPKIDSPDGLYLDHSGKYAYIMGKSNSRLNVIDITDPTTPSLVTSFQDASVIGTPEAVHVTGDYAYIADNTGSMGVIDISNPANPTSVTSLSNTTLLNGADEIVVRGSYAYIGAATANQVVAININDPSTPFIAGNVTGSTFAHTEKVEFGLGYAYSTAADADAINVIKIPRIVSGKVLSCPAFSSSSLDCTGQETKPVDGATVEVWAVNKSAITADSGQTLEERAKELLRQMENPEPPGWEADLQLTGDGGLFAGADGTYAAIHSKESWGLERWSDEAHLQNPIYHLPTNEEVVVSTWDPSRNSRFQDGIEKQLPGAIDDDKDIIFERVDHTGDVVQTIRVQTNNTHALASIGDSNIRGHDIGLVRLPAGFYNVQVENSSVSYTVVVGSKEELVQKITHDLKTDAGTYTRAAQQAQNYLNDQTLFREVTTTDEDGTFSIQVGNPNAHVVSIVSYRGDGNVLSDDPNPTIGDLVRASENGYNGSVYMSPKAVRTTLPAREQTIYVKEFSSPPFQDYASYLDRFNWVEDYLNESRFTDLGGPFQQRLEDTDRESLEEVYTQLNSLRTENEDLRARYRELLEQSGNEDIDVNVDAGDLSDTELNERIRALETALNEMRDTVETGDPTQSISNQTVSLRFPFDGELKPEATAVLVHYANGTSAVMDSRYWRVDSQIGRGDAVVVEGFPISNTALANIEVRAATESGDFGRSNARVKNPAFSRPPSLASIGMTTLNPGPSERVTFTLNPAEDSSFRNLTDVTIYGPNGANIPVEPIQNGNSASFLTAGKGVYHIRMEMQDTNGNAYVETLRIRAAESDLNLPPGIRVKSGITGIYAVVGDGFANGDVEVEKASKSIHVTGIVSLGAEVPDEAHIYTGEVLSAQETSTRITVLKESDPEPTSISQRLTVIIHGRRLSEDAIVYRDSNDPITEGSGTHHGVVQRQPSSTIVESYTSESGGITIHVNNNPGLIDRLEFRGRVLLSGLSMPPIPFTVEFPSGVGAGVGIGAPAVPLIGLYAHRRKRGDHK